MNDTVLQFLTEVFASSDGNRLPAAYGGHRLFDTPMIGVTAGDDPMIDRFKDVVARAHLTPAEMWSKSAGPGRRRRSGSPIGRPRPDAGTWGDLTALATKLKVLSIVFPYAKELLHDGSRSPQRTPMTGLALNFAHAFHTEVYAKITQFFLDAGHRVMVPQKSRFYTVLVRMSPPHIVSAWSERHYAFAAGLGTFGLAEHLITDRGCNVRLASVLTDAPLTVTPRASDDPFGNCLYHQRGTCAKCVERCPGAALRKDAHNKLLCEWIRQKQSAHVRHELKPFLKPITRTFLYVPVTECPIGCAVCQYRVPCMDRNPMAGRRPLAPQP